MATVVTGAQRPLIFVLAGVNGAGNSSVAGAILEAHGLTWFNPDSYARELLQQQGWDQGAANAAAWAFGKERLEAAIAHGTNFAFETTLGARTIPRLLREASKTHAVIMLFCGLSSVEKHIERVARRVEHGGHDIPTEKIRERWLSSRQNLIELLPHLAELQLFDNSATAGPGEEIPSPILLLKLRAGRMVLPAPTDVAALMATPDWAKPIVEAALDGTPSP